MLGVMVYIVLIQTVALVAILYKLHRIHLQLRAEARTLIHLFNGVAKEMGWDARGKIVEVDREGKTI